MADEKQPTESKESTEDQQKGKVADMTVEEAEKKDAKKVKALRDEAAKYRTKAKKTAKEYDQFKEKVQSLFGGDQEDDFESQVKSLKSENQRLRQENVLRSTSAKLGLDADLVTAKVIYANLLDGVDLSDSKQVEEVLSALAEENPRLKTGSLKFGDTERGGTEKKKRTMNDFIRGI